MLEQPLINKYRPESFEEVIGHVEITRSLQRAMTSNSRPHAFLLTGPSGLGKTTIARILGKNIGAEILELDAASNNGVDAMRALIEMSQYRSMRGTGLRMYIIDECHMLSKSAWNSILKMLEEPPEHLFIALCTTDLGKVIDTVKQRCFHIALRPISDRDIEDLVLAVAEAEKWDVAPDVTQVVVQAATGQPRKALSILQAVHDASSREEVRRIITLMDDSEPVIELLRAFVAGKQLQWQHVRDLIKKLEGDDFEQIMEACCGYLTAVMFNAETERQANLAWDILSIFTKPVATYNKKAAFAVALGHVLALPPPEKR